MIFKRRSPKHPDEEMPEEAMIVDPNDDAHIPAEQIMDMIRHTQFCLSSYDTKADCDCGATRYYEALSHEQMIVSSENSHSNKSDFNISSEGVSNASSTHDRTSY